MIRSFLFTMVLVPIFFLWGVDTEPYPTAPPCSNHDPTKYHGLWNQTDDCHYDHTHNVDPSSAAVIAVFGDYANWTGQEISYPWQTYAGAAPGLDSPPPNAIWENTAKHGGYKFDFYDFSAASYGCPKADSSVRAVPKAWLIERHSLGNKHDFMARIHSTWAMIKFCIPGTSEWAYLFTGGWQDFGQRVSPYQGHIYPIPGSPFPVYPSPRPPYISHACQDHVDCAGSENQSNTSWLSFMQMIPGHKLFGFGFRTNDSQQKIDASDGFDTADPVFVYLCHDENGEYVAAGCEFNNSATHTYQLTAVVPASYDLLDGVDDDRVNYDGWTNRWGDIVAGCTVNALDCVPVHMDNLPVGKYHVNVAQYGLTGIHENLPDYDVFFEGTPAGWIGPEN